MDVPYGPGSDEVSDLYRRKEVLRPQFVIVWVHGGAYDIGSVDLNGRYGWFVRTILWAYSGGHDFMNDEQFRLASITAHVNADFPRSFISSATAVRRRDRRCDWRGA